MNAASLDYRDQFLSILNNRDKTRHYGFLVFVHGSVDLESLEKLCFDRSLQSYNDCLTVRYGAETGDVLTGLIGQFQEDIFSLMGDASPTQSKIVSRSPAPSSALGVFRPSPTEGKWSSLLSRLREWSRDSREDIIDPLFSILNSTLTVGDRLVIFCELSGISQGVTLEDLGFDDRVKRLLTHLPERMGLVFSGLPTGLDIPELGERLLQLEVGPDIVGTAPERSQPLKNDSPRGEDRLQITSEVNALADAIAGKDMDPPLVVGVLGGWGSGKSFILQLLQERLRFIRNQDLTDDAKRNSNPYVGHPYLVHFDAWTYAKSDLWASLMERILFDLDQQLDLEQTVASVVDLRKGFDLWEIIANSSPAQLEALRQDLGQEALELIKDWKQGANTSRALWSALQKLREEELKSLKRAEEALAQRQQASADELRTAQIESEQMLLEAGQRIEQELLKQQVGHQQQLGQLQAKLESTQSRIVTEVDQEFVILARKQAWDPIFDEFKSFFGSVADHVLKESGVESNDGPVSVWMIAKEVRLTTKYSRGLLKSPLSIVFLIVTFLSVAVLAYLAQTELDSMLTTLAGFTGVVGGAVASGYTALTQVNRWFIEKQTIYETKVKALSTESAALRESKLTARKQAEVQPIETDIKSLQDTYAFEIKAFEEREREKLKNLNVNEKKQLEEKKLKNEAEIQTLQKDVEEHARRAGIPGQSDSLMDLLQKRIQSGYYNERLGILHQVQKDLQEITEALLPIQGHDEELFPRGAPRVILIIDDLDRCPPTQVVQVLEAAQLLVKTRLFVVVISMDVRYVTRALEKEYEGILVRTGNPSGLDYTEKIVQIPYRVRPIAASAMAAYLYSQVVLRQVVEEHFSPSPSGTGTRTLHPARITAPGQANERVNETLPPEIQEFELAELELLEAAALSVEISPRATKRLVNVVKLIKNIWYRKGVELPDLEVKRAIVLLLTLSASFPEAMARILDELERDMRNSISQSAVRFLGAALQEIVLRWAKLEGIAEDWAAVLRLVQNEKLLSAHLTLETFGLDNLQLVRSFSFLGEVEMPLVERIQKHTVDLLSSPDNAASDNHKETLKPIRPASSKKSAKKKNGKGPTLDFETRL